MEQTKLPNANKVLILGILSIFGCYCYGIVGMVLAIFALRFAAKDAKLYAENPEMYSNYSSIAIGKVFAIIGIVLNAIIMIFIIYLLSLGEQGMKDFQQNLLDKMEQMKEQNQ